MQKKFRGIVVSKSKGRTPTLILLLFKARVFVFQFVVVVSQVLIHKYLRERQDQRNEMWFDVKIVRRADYRKPVHRDHSRLEKWHLIVNFICLHHIIWGTQYIVVM